MKLMTKILHHPFLKEDPHGSLHMPIYENVAFAFKSAEDIELAFQRKKPAHAYSRITNPTVEYFEQQIRAITEATGVVALSSGMAAIANTIIAIASSGDNIITSRHLFGNTYSLFSSTLAHWGLETRFADLTRPQEILPLIDDKTRGIFFETITNPQMEVVDVKALSAIAKEHHIVLIADTTLTPPSVFQSKNFGVDIELLSSTKYISGGATSVGGLIIDNGTYDWRYSPKLTPEARQFGPFALITLLRRNVYRNLGSCMSPHVAFQQSIGLETLPLRIRASCKNALAVARFLKEQSQVTAVDYPGLSDSPYYAISREQFGDLPGGILTFDLASKETCFAFMNRLKLLKRSTNLNDNRTLILHPASTIFCEYSEASKQEQGVRETMIRLSVGIEDTEDIMDDIQQALEGI